VQGKTICRVLKPAHAAFAAAIAEKPAGRFMIRNRTPGVKRHPEGDWCRCSSAAPGKIKILLGDRLGLVQCPRLADLVVAHLPLGVPETLVHVIAIRDTPEPTSRVVIKVSSQWIVDSHKKEDRDP
jgi:hypothetical protein